MRGSFSLLGHWRALHRGCAARARWTKRAWNLKETWFVEVSRGHEDSMQIGRVEASSPRIVPTNYPGQRGRANGRPSCKFVSTIATQSNCSPVLVTCKAAQPRITAFGLQVVSGIHSFVNFRP